MRWHSWGVIRHRLEVVSTKDVEWMRDERHYDPFERLRLPFNIHLSSFIFHPNLPYPCRSSWGSVSTSQNRADCLNRKRWTSRSELVFDLWSFSLLPHFQSIIRLSLLRIVVLSLHRVYFVLFLPAHLNHVRVTVSHSKRVSCCWRPCGVHVIPSHLVHISESAAAEYFFDRPCEILRFDDLPLVQSSQFLLLLLKLQ